MKENLKTDYLKFLFTRAKKDLTRFNISNQDSEFIRNVFDRLSRSENILIELYILSNIKEFRNIGKYFIFILKKIEDDVITFDNLSQNISADSEFIQNEILNYLSNPKPRENIQFKYEDAPEQMPEESSEKFISTSEEGTQIMDVDDEPEDDSCEESDVSRFKKNYLELIQSEESGDEIVYDLPTADTNQENEGESAFDITGLEKQISNGIELGEPLTEKEQTPEDIIRDDAKDQVIFEEKQADEEIETVTEEEIQQGEIDDKINFEEDQTITIKDSTGVEDLEEERIPLSDEIQEEINLFKEGGEGQLEEEDDTEEEPVKLPPTNELFLEYENEISNMNEYLNVEFDRMIKVVNTKGSSDEERIEIIKNILGTTAHLENISREMSLEIISNIYQTITLSFEKISEGKYDISESTLNLYKKGLSLVISLIKGDDYFGYKDILKSIENIRNALLEEKQKREIYLKRLQEKLDLENNLSSRYPDDTQKEKLTMLKQIIKDTEVKFNLIDKISGEYQIYEALRSLSGNLNNFKEIVKLSRELEMRKSVQLAEAGYIFVKFLQNYRINPVTSETKKIFEYIIHNLKSLVLGKPSEDIDLFISYLNDPVKIFSKPEKKEK